LASSLTGLTPTEAHKKFAATFCSKCTGGVIPSCEQLFFAPGDQVPEELRVAGKVILPLSDGLTAQLETECASANPLTCVANFSSCAQGVLANNALPTETGKCLLDALISGSSTTGSSSCDAGASGGAGGAGGAGGSAGSDAGVGGTGGAAGGSGGTGGGGAGGTGGSTGCAAPGDSCAFNTDCCAGATCLNLHCTDGPVSSACQSCGQSACINEGLACLNDYICSDCVLYDAWDPLCKTNPAAVALMNCACSQCYSACWTYCPS
jgi:hypothetical protein